MLYFSTIILLWKTFDTFVKNIFLDFKNLVLNLHLSSKDKFVNMKENQFKSVT